MTTPSPILERTDWSALTEPRVLVAFATSALATLWLARLARRLAWTDRAHDASEVSRKVAVGEAARAAPAPLVGGAAVLAGLVAAVLMGGAPRGLFEAPARATLGGTVGSSEPFTWLALLAAFGVGLVDDLHGLAPRGKLAGQLLAGALLVAPACWSGAVPAGDVALFLAGALVAQNAINTFDNSDGAAASVAALGLVPALPVAAAAVLGFLPFNLARRTRLGRARPFLGDSGSHLLGLLILAHPLAWPALLLPSLDLARVAVVRLRRGRAPWLGDRRHLAHRLARAGLSRGGVCLCLVAIAAPASLGLLVAGVGPLVGALATALLFGVAVASTPDPDAPDQKVTISASANSRSSRARSSA